MSKSKPPPPTMEEMIAAYMVKRLEEVEYLDQATAASDIQEKFGAEFVYTNDGGGTGINKKVLAKFRQLTGDAVVWEPGNLLWRKRTKYDLPSRRQN